MPLGSGVKLMVNTIIMIFKVGYGVLKMSYTLSI